MSPKPDERGFKPGANMPHKDYDPKKEGMSESGNHAVGHAGNDTPYGYQNQQQDQANAEQAVHQNQNLTNQHNQQSAKDAATATTHRTKTTGLRGDDYTENNREGGKR